MRAVERRLARLEQRYRPVDPVAELQRAWLDTLTIEDLEDTETALEHINAGGELDTLLAEVRERYLAVVESWQRYLEEHLS